MTSRILHEMTTGKSFQHLPLPILEEISPRALVCQVLDQVGGWERRERKLNHVFMVYLLIAWTISPLMALKQVQAQLISALRWLSPVEPARPPGAWALCYRRWTLGVSPLRLLMRLACQPLCQPETPGAFLFGRRLIAIDSKLINVAESADNDWTFRGRTRDDQPRHKSPFPQLRLVWALEIGSHAHLGAVLAAGSRSEMSLVQQLLSFLPAGSLVLQDAGFRGAWWMQPLVQHGHHSITRIQANDYPCKGPRLADGSYLVQTRGSWDAPLKEPLTLRIIEYRLSPELAEPLSQMQKSRMHSGLRPVSTADQVSRLATTLLDPIEAPAREMAACSHERWELELVYDEREEHQLSTPHLLSKTSMGVIQEGWAMLLGHSAVRAWMMQSACEPEPLDVDRLSFTQALCVLGTALTLSEPLSKEPKERWKPRLLQDLRQPESRLAPRRLRCSPRVVKLARTRFFAKKEKDVPFVFPDQTKTWKDFVLLLHSSESNEQVLLI